MSPIFPFETQIKNISNRNIGHKIYQFYFVFLDSVFSPLYGSVCCVGLVLFILSEEVQLDPMMLVCTRWAVAWCRVFLQTRRIICFQRWMEAEETVTKWIRKTLTLLLNVLHNFQNKISRCEHYANENHSDLTWDPKYQTNFRF